MTFNTFRSSLFGSLAIVVLSSSLPTRLSAQGTAAQTATAHPSAVLIELFTSEGCSDCPPADELLQQVSGHRTAEGQLIVGISEHVSYWNGLGWKDPFSSDLYTGRQNDYSSHFGLGSVYTPQMVVTDGNSSSAATGAPFRLRSPRSRSADRSHSISIRPSLRK